jgi:hypothetical protein
MTDDKWQDIDERALSAIQLSLSFDILREVMHEKSATTLWKKLEELYMTKSLANKLRLMERLYTIRVSEGTSMQSHLNEINLIIVDLESLDMKIDDEDKAVSLVVSSTLLLSILRKLSFMVIILHCLLRMLSQICYPSGIRARVRHIVFIHMCPPSSPGLKVSSGYRIISKDNRLNNLYYLQCSTVDDEVVSIAF